MTSHIFDLFLRSLPPFVTQVLVPSHQRKPNFDDRTVFPRTTTTRPLASLPASTHRKFRYGSTLFMRLPHTELPTLSQWPQADLSHTSIASSVAPSCLATPSFCSAKARSYLIPDVLCVITYMVYDPTAPISACNTSNRYL